MDKIAEKEDLRKKNEAQVTPLVLALYIPPT